MTTTTATLTDFLLARIAEDEAAARYIIDGDHWHGIHVDSATQVATHINKHDPARVLAECAAKRRVISIAQAQVNSIGEGRPHRSFLSGRVHDGAAILSALALPYADHPDYDESWRP